MKNTDRTLQLVNGFVVLPFLYLGGEKATCNSHGWAKWRSFFWSPVQVLPVFGVFQAQPSAHCQWSEHEHLRVLCLDAGKMNEPEEKERLTLGKCEQAPQAIWVEHSTC